MGSLPLPKDRGWRNFSAPPSLQLRQPFGTQNPFHSSRFKPIVSHYPLNHSGLGFIYPPFRGGLPNGPRIAGWKRFRRGWAPHAARDEK